MSFSVERAALRGRLAEAQARQRRLETLIESQANSARQLLNTVLTPPVDLDVPQIVALVENLSGMWGELQATVLEISRLERELH